ncbi:MAG: hypothetical protein FWH41_02895, partial [Treponema sp.]|nr:hypothetical protein [Treponema sp.]
VPIFIENIGASSTDLDTTYLGFLRFHDVSYNYSGTGAKITGSNIESLIPGDNYSFSVTFDLGKASEKTGSVNGEVLDKLYVIIEDCLSKGSVTHDWDGDHPGDLTGPGDGGTNNQGYHGVGWYKAITDHEGVNCIGIMDINYGPAPQWGLNQGTFGRDSALATDDGVKTWNLTGMTKIRFKYLISVPEGGMFQSGSLKLALDDDEYGISFPPFQTFDTWLDAEITISGLTNVTSYFLTFSADPYLIAGKENGVFIYITPIIAWEY